MEGHGDENSRIFSIAFSPNNQQLASGSDDGTIKIWDLTSGGCIQTLEGHSGYVWSVAFSPDCQQLASGSGDKTARIWDLTSGSCVHILEGHLDTIVSAAFSADGQRLVSLSDWKLTAIKVWDLTSGSCALTFKINLNGSSNMSSFCEKPYITFDPAGRCLLTDTSRIELPEHPMNTSVRLDRWERREYRGYGMLGDFRRWITRDGRNVLWLPLEYRSHCYAVQRRIVALGCESGVVTIGFSRDV